MRIHLIAPTKKGERYLFNKGLLAPLGIMYLAASTPDWADVKIIDESVEFIDFTDLPDLVGISTMTATAVRAYEIADAYRSRGVKVVMGGVHASMVTDEALKHADSVVIGEAEDIWPKVVEDAAAGCLEPIYKSETRNEFKRPLMPRRDLINNKLYWTTNAVQTSRGCPHACNFCSVTAYNGRKVRHRDTDSVLEEVETLQRNNLLRKKVVAFVDDNIAASPKRAKDLFARLEPMDLMWGSQASITVANDEELVAMASASGCRFLFIGLETLSPESLKEMGKDQNRIEMYAQALRTLKKHKIHVMGAFVFGFDSDNESVFGHTLDFALDNKLQIAQFANLTPYPGTRLYEQLLSENRVTPGFWLKPSWEDAVVFRPNQMSPERLHAKTHDVHLDFYSYRSIMKRMSLKRHWSYWLAFNLLYRQTVVAARSQGLAEA